jgi:hypothetical protein
MIRSISENPKESHESMLARDLPNGLLTLIWKRKLERFLKILVPDHISPDDQIWLSSSQELATFLEQLRNKTIDLGRKKYVVISEPIHDLYDLIDFFSRLHDQMPKDGTVIFTAYNFFWAPIFRVGHWLRLSRNKPNSRFYLENDIETFTSIAGWENNRKVRPFILPMHIPILSQLLDGFLIRLPIFNSFALNTVYISRKRVLEEPKDYSVTVLIPCKNEEKNIHGIVSRMPKFGADLELVFINDNSDDDTEREIKQATPAFSNQKIKLIQGLGGGKGKAVKAGMSCASGDICMILDADLTVIPEDLPQFYRALQHRYADFVHGTRLVYPQEVGAMRYFNLLGNIAFAWLFSFILDQRTTDTLCGTKAFWKKDWPKFLEIEKRLGNSDIWGDYNLIFGATHFGLKISQLPVRYFERIEGQTKMTKRLHNALIMLRVCWHALWKIKFTVA